MSWEFAWGQRVNWIVNERRRKKSETNDTTNRWTQTKYSTQSSHKNKRMGQNWVDVISLQICLKYYRMTRIDTNIVLIKKSIYIYIYIYRYSFISMYLYMRDSPRDDKTIEKVLNNSVLSRVIQRFLRQVNSEEYLRKEEIERNRKK